MSLFRGCKGTKRYGGMCIASIDRHDVNENETMRQVAERKVEEFKAMMPGARVWVFTPRGNYLEIRTSSRKLRDMVNNF